MGAVNIKLYDLLKTDFHLSDKKAMEFAQAIQEIAVSEAKNESHNYKSELKEDMLRLEIKMEQNKSELLLKWFIGLFVALALMIIGLYIKK
ncbi:hypothetical protein [Parasediminibacterium sp. JCM 36343]|uniref:hypothetical protein n=1 Tax=Parasediminibacterium sp. JCM 36343 TaxID=3374279 RepID=UPI00397CBFCE